MNSEKSYHKVASSTDEAGGNQPHAETQHLELNQLPELHYSTSGEKLTIVDVQQTAPALPQSNNGSPLLILLIGVIERYIACSRPVAFTVALWLMMTWCFKAFKVIPILCITAPMKGSGKTQLLKLVSYLSCNSFFTSNITAAALFRKIETDQPTLCMDEVDTYLMQDNTMRGILNAGFEYNGTVIRCNTDKGNKLEEFIVFCPKALSGIGKLPDTVDDRSIVISMRPKAKGESKERLRYADMAEFAVIKQQLAQWADENFSVLSQARPALPEGLSDRKLDCWECLFSISDLLGEETAQEAREVAVLISGEIDNACDRKLLLEHIKEVFETNQWEKVLLKDLVGVLCLNETAPWSTWHNGRSMTTYQLSKILSDFGIKAHQMRVVSNNGKGYLLSDFTQCFTDYLD